MDRDFLIVAPSYTHKSAGVRALYRLCHHLNVAGYQAAMLPMLGQSIDDLPPWLTPLHAGAVGDSVVVYPEIVPGNPYEARKVVRWALNIPGLLGGDRFYRDDEVVFVFNPTRLGVVSQAVRTPLGPDRVLFLGLVDPANIYPDDGVAKVIDCYFTGKGAARRERWRLPDEASYQRLEDITPTMASLGDVLRRTGTLYSYDHASNVLKEAVICGCRVVVVDENGGLHDPQSCSCAYNIYWEPGFREGYARRYHDSSFVHDSCAC